MKTLRYLARLLRWVSIVAWRRVAADVHFWIAAGDTASCVHARIEGQAPPGRKVCIFVHYDAAGVLHPHSRRYIEALAAEGFGIVFVSNSATTQDTLDYLSRRCIRILLRDNRGYDFGAYRDAILDLGADLQPLSMLVLANDSVYAPLSPLATLFGGIDFANADVWGATDSWQQRYHLQSYFIAFGPAALAHPAFLKFWRGVRNARSKWAVVKHYEIGLTPAMQAAGLRCAAVFHYQGLIRHAQAIVEAQAGVEAESPPPSQTMAALLRAAAERALHDAARRRASNPVIDRWLLLADAGGPFIKRELLRDDPTRLPDLFAWHRIMQDRAPALYRDVMDDLKRVMRRSAP